MEEFKNACLEGKVKIAKQLYSNNRITNKVLDSMFYKTLYKRSIREFITSKTNIKLNANRMRSILFYDLYRHSGSLIKWIIESKTLIIDEKVYSDMMLACSYFNRFELCEKLNKRGVRYSKCELINAFFYNKVELIKQLYPQFEYSEELICEFFKFAFINRNIELVKWLRIANPNYVPVIRMICHFVFPYYETFYERNESIIEEKPDIEKTLYQYQQCYKSLSNMHRRRMKSRYFKKAKRHLIQFPDREELKNENIIEFMTWFFSYFDIPFDIDYYIGRNFASEKYKEIIKWIITKNYILFDHFIGYLECLKEEYEFITWLIKFMYNKDRNYFEQIKEHLLYIASYESIKWYFETTLDINVIEETIECVWYDCVARFATYNNHLYIRRRCELTDDYIKSVLYVLEQAKILDLEIEKIDEINKLLKMILRKERRIYIHALDSIDQLLHKEVLYDSQIFSHELFKYLCI